MAGLYIHIPFCKARCLYCDFTTYTGREDRMGPYVRALAKEVELQLGGAIPDSIFIGGGTPTSLNDESFQLLMDIIRPLTGRPTQEVTIEANPEAVTPVKVQMMKAGGINRVSMGLQSTDNILLRNIGRIHSYERFIESYELLRKEGFTNLSFDLITALPGQDETVIRETIKKAIELQPEHVSVYSMILEEGTPFYTLHEAGKLTLPDDETDRKFQDLFLEYLEKAGYHRYEISNYSRPGFESRHNLNYWNFGEYYACGVAASGFMNGVRHTNTRSLDDYIEGMENGGDIRAEVHTNSLEDSMEEFLFMGLRKTEGVSLSEFQERFGKDLFHVYGDIPQRFLEGGHMIRENDRLRLSSKGLDISNYILSDFMLTGS